MSKIKVLVAAGVEIRDAIKASLGMTLREFAEKHGLHETAVSAVINGSTPHPYESVRTALAIELEVERDWLDERLPRKAVA